MFILTAKEMQQADRQAIERYGIPSVVLMENAAGVVMDVLMKRYPKAQRVIVLCGKGNNGGDGLAVARLLHNKGLGVDVFLFAPFKDLQGDAKTNLGIAQKMGVPIQTIKTSQQFGEQLPALASADLLVDALFGTGLEHPLEGLWEEVVETLNAVNTPVLAVDIPSGLDASSAEVIGPVVAADATVTFAALKLAHIFPPAAPYCGEVVVGDIGIPNEVMEGLSTLRLATPEELMHFLPERPEDSHKGRFGHVAAVCGSMEKPGAAAMTCLGALKCGSGLATAASVPEVLAAVAHHSYETMGLKLDATSEGTVSRKGLPRLLSFLQDKDALVVGPGLSTVPETAEFILELVQTSLLPLVLDADGLNAFAGKAHLLKKRAAPMVLTPHPGELARLLGCSADEIQKDRVKAVQELADVTGAVSVLKGHLTLTASPAGAVWVNTTGNAGMATGGMGDVLSGMIGSFLGQGIPAGKAAVLGVFLHGLAADLAVAKSGPASLLPRDVLEALPEAFRTLNDAQ
jgi:NAD(P)H-hydrate epimerase